MASLYDLLVSAISLPTKSEFGKKMHDPNLSDEDKEEILQKVADNGGYENLED